MRARLQAAPAFIQFLVSGLIGGLIAVVIQKLWEHDSWTHALAYGLFLGFFLAVVETFTTGRRRGDIAAMTAGLTPAQRVQAFRTAVRAPVPTEPRVRQAAIRFAEYRLAEYGRHRVAGWWVCGAIAAVFAVLAITTSPFYWLAVAGFVGVCAQDLIELRRLRRRIEMLRAAATGQAAVV